MQYAFAHIRSFYVGKIYIYIYINVLNLLICFRGSGKIVRSLEAHVGNDRVSKESCQGRTYKYLAPSRDNDSRRVLALS